MLKSMDASTKENYDSAAAMWPTAMGIPLWINREHGDKPMLHPSFDAFSAGPIYNSARWPDPAAASNYDASKYAEHKWSLAMGDPSTASANPAVTAAAMGSQMFFPTNFGASPQTGNVAEPPYPTDPYPSTSSAGTAVGGTVGATPTMPDGYKFNINAAAPYYPMYSSYSDYQSFAWKMPGAMAHVNSSSNSKQKNTQQTPNPPYRTGPGTNNVRVRTSEKYRAVYSDFQRLELEKEFHTQKFINSERKTQLSTELQLTERQIKIWFQNRRAKDRRDKRKGN